MPFSKYLDKSVDFQVPSKYLDKSVDFQVPLNK